MRIKFYAFVLLFFLTFVSAGVQTVFSQTETPTPTPNSSSQKSNIQDCADNNISVADCPQFLQKKVSDLQGQEKTLSSQIAIMNNQIELTEARIAATQEKIRALGKDIDIAKGKVSGLEQNIGQSTKALLGRIAGVYQIGSINPWEMLLTSDSISNFMTRLTYLKLVQVYDKKNIYAAEQAKNDYNNQKQIFEDKQKEQQALSKKLQDYTTQLEGEKKNKQTLLSETQGSETRYQKLLEQARAQISAFKSFASSAGGASILPPQPSPDGWYYNQRDSRWGSNMIGSSGEQVWAVGCLLTATTMVMKKHGASITPGDTAANSSYFFSDTAYMLLPWIGGRFTSIWGNSQSDIDGKLASGEPVIVGLHAGAFGQHFVVLKSGSGGNYIMNDPWYGPNLNFTDHYSTGQIFQYGWYNG